MYIYEQSRNSGLEVEIWIYSIYKLLLNVSWSCSLFPQMESTSQEDQTVRCSRLSLQKEIGVVVEVHRFYSVRQSFFFLIFLLLRITWRLFVEKLRWEGHQSLPLWRCRVGGRRRPKATTLWEDSHAVKLRHYSDLVSENHKREKAHNLLLFNWTLGVKK